MTENPRKDPRTLDLKEDPVAADSRQIAITECPKEDPVSEDTKNDPINEDPKYDPFTEDSKETLITDDTNEDLITKDPKEKTMSLRTLKKTLSLKALIIDIYFIIAKIKFSVATYHVTTLLSTNMCFPVSNSILYLVREKLLDRNIDIDHALYFPSFCLFQHKENFMKTRFGNIFGNKNGMKFFKLIFKSSH